MYFLKNWATPPQNQEKGNVTNKEYQAMRNLYNNPNITIKPVDKGGNIVIMNTEDYIVEANR